MVLNVEAAYWNPLLRLLAALLGRTGDAASLRDLRVDEGPPRSGQSGPAGTRPGRGPRFEDFRVRRVTALQNVLTAELTIRNLLGMKLEDGQAPHRPRGRSVTVALTSPTWQGSLSEMFGSRPELNLARQELKARQFDVILQKGNSLRPDVRFLSGYNVNGIGQEARRHHVERPGVALGQQVQLLDRFGLRADVPIGFRDAYSAVRTFAAELSPGSYVVVEEPGA